MLANTQVTPQLNAQVTEPLHFLETHFHAQRKEIENWFQAQWNLTAPPVYGSVDLRNAGFKVAPIDMNLFPAGFNNLNPNFIGLAVSAAKKVISQLAPQAKKLLIVPEGHTRNLFYWTNVYTLQQILLQAGYEIRLGTLDEEVTKPLEVILPTNEKLTIEPLIRNDDQLQVLDFVPDFILLNNDLSEGIPAILENLRQPIIPPAELGWSQRLKSEHFQYYANVAEEFATQFHIDPWLIAPLFRYCGQINFLQQEGLECLITNAETLFAEIKKKYEEYQIPHQPFLIVKADAGTYGMAVMTVRNIDELRAMNRKQRTRMSMTKGGQSVDKVIIQEGVYTFETLGNAVAEPVVYLFGSTVIGGFYRVHQNRGVDENLNSPGMKFEPIAFSQACHEPCDEIKAHQNQLYVYGIVAQLSMLAAAREMKEQSQ